MTAAPVPEDPDVVSRRLLAQLGAAMISGGSTVTNAEAAVCELGRRLGHPAVQVSATPTDITLALASGQSATIERIHGSLRLDQTFRVGTVRRELLAGRMSPAQAQAALQQVRPQPARYGAMGLYVGLALVSMGICLIMQPVPGNVLLVGGCSLLVSFLIRTSGRQPLLAALLPSVAAFLTSLLVLLASQHGWVEGPLRTLICPLAVLLPGALLSTGIAELAGGSMISGTSRLVHGIVQLLLFTLGVVGAALLLDVPTSSLVNNRVVELGPWAAPLGLALISLGITLSEAVPWRLFGWTSLVLVCTFVAQQTGQLRTSSLPLGAFLGALVANFLSTAIEARFAGVPRLILFLPSFWLLVPGTLGLMGITTVGMGTGQAEAITGVLTLVTAIALGLLVGSAIALPLPRMARRLHRGAQAE